MGALEQRVRGLLARLPPDDPHFLFLRALLDRLPRASDGSLDQAALAELERQVSSALRGAPQALIDLLPTREFAMPAAPRSSAERASSRPGGGSGGGDGKEGEAKGTEPDGKDINEAVAESPLLTSFFGGRFGAEKDLAAAAAEMLQSLIAADTLKSPSTAAVGGGVPETAAPAHPAQEKAPAATQSAPRDPNGNGGGAERTSPAPTDRGRADPPSPRLDPTQGVGMWGIWAARGGRVTPASLFRWFAAQSAAAAGRRRVRRPVERIRRPGLHLPVSNRD
jgi:hypothetical protein